MGCEYCDENSACCEVIYDEREHDYKLQIQTCEWSDHDDEFITIELSIKYCPYCGRKLGDKNV